MRTAASYLKTISESSTVNKYELTPITEHKSPKPMLERTGTTLINTFSIDNKRDSLWTSMAFRRKSTNKASRDISHLNDIKYSKTEPDLPVLSDILPKELETLKTYLFAVQEPRIRSQRSQMCFRNSCIGHFSEKVKETNLSSPLDNLGSPRDFGGPTSQLEILNLKEWFRYMKETHLNKIIEEVKDAKDGRTKVVVGDSKRLEDYEVVLKAGMKEFTKQLSALNSDRSELLMEFIHHLGLYWSSKLELTEKFYDQRFKVDKSTIKGLHEDIINLKTRHKEKSRLLKKELGVIRSENLLNSLEMEKLQEIIKKLKADRLHRTKIELQKYNSMIKEFQEFRKSTLANPEDPNNIQIARALQKKRDSLTSLIINKTQLVHSDTLTSSRLSEEHLIEHAMLSLNCEDIFVDKSTQIKNSHFAKEISQQVDLVFASIGVETEESLIMAEPEEFKDEMPPVEKSVQLFSIFITNENEEKVLAFSKQVNLSNSELSSPLNISVANSGELDKSCSDEPKRRKSIFKSRYSNTLATQTEEEVFADMLRMEEEEFYDWILTDRKNHLHNIQRQILNTKTEFNKVNKFVTNHKNQLCQSFNVEEGLDISMNSEDNFNLSADEDLECLRNSGIIGPDVDIPSWREGYTFGFESRINGKKPSLTPGKMRKTDDSFELNKSIEGNIFKPRHKRSPSDEIKRKRSTKFQEFKFTVKETKHIAPKTVKPRFLQTFLEASKVGSMKRMSNTSKKMVLKIISSVYSSAIAKDVIEFPSLHIFVYEEFLSKYGQVRVVNKKIMDLMAAVVSYTEERKITTFAKLFGISTKVNIPCYARPKQAFNFFVTFNRLLENSHFGIDVGEIKGQVFVPLIRALECSKEILGKIFDPIKVSQVTSAIEKKSIVDPNKINKRLVEHEGLLEILLEVYNNYNSVIEKAIIELLSPFRFLGNPKKIHKFDFVMVLKYFYPEKFPVVFPNSPLDFFEHQLGHPKTSNLISFRKVVDLCFQNKLLFPEEIAEKMLEMLVKKKIDLMNVGLKEELFKYREDFYRIVENSEKLELDKEFIGNWGRKIEMVIDQPDDVPDNVKVFWRIMAWEVRKLVSLC